MNESLGVKCRNENLGCWIYFSLFLALLCFRLVRLVVQGLPASAPPHATAAANHVYLVLVTETLTECYQVVNKTYIILTSTSLSFRQRKSLLWFLAAIQVGVVAWECDPDLIW